LFRFLPVTVRLPVVTVDADSGDVKVHINNTVPLQVHSVPIATTFAIFEEYVILCSVFLICCNNILYTPSAAGCTALSTKNTRPLGVSVAGTTVWNLVPDKLRYETENTFRQSL